MKISARVKKLLSITLIGGTVLSSLAGMAFADNLNNGKETENKESIKIERIEKKRDNKQGDFEEVLSKLIEKGIITQEEGDKWKVFQEEEFNARQEERKAEMEKVKSMTEEERKAYFEEKKGQSGLKEDRMSALVEAGILTQEKVDAIKDTMAEIRHTEMKQKMQEHINKLVEEGIITQEEGEKWIAFQEQKQEERQAEMEKVKSMTDEERRAYFEEKKSDRKDGLSELVEAGVISQEKADEIKAKMPQKQNGDKEGKRGPGHGFKEMNKSVEEK